MRGGRSRVRGLLLPSGLGPRCALAYPGNHQHRLHCGEPL